MRFQQTITPDPVIGSMTAANVRRSIVAIMLASTIGACATSGTPTDGNRVLSTPEVSRLSELLAEVPDTPPSDCTEIIAGDRFNMYPENVKRLIRKDSKQRGLPIAADSSYRFGFEQAAEDIRLGVLVYHNVGEPTLFTDHRGDVWLRDRVLEDILLRDYGIRTVHWGEATTTSQWAFLCGYGQVFDSVSQMFFGDDVITQAVLNVENEVLVSGRKNKKRWLAQE